jgi:hypothetical protein
MLSTLNFVTIVEVAPINVLWKQLYPGMGNNLFAANLQLGINPLLGGSIPSFPFKYKPSSLAARYVSLFLSKIKWGISGAVK